MLREMIRGFAQRMMDAEVARGVGYREVSPARVNSRNGYQPRSGTPGPGPSSWRSRSCGTGPIFPSFLEHSRRAELALAPEVATSCLLGVSTWVEKLSASLGATGLSKSQVSVMVGELAERAVGFRNRELDVGPYTFVWIDARPARPGRRRAGSEAAAGCGAPGRGPRRHPRLRRAVWRQVWLSNPQERLNMGIRRRIDVVGIFPGRDAIIRLVGVVLAEQNDEWTETRRYMGTEILTECRKAAKKEEARETEITSVTELATEVIPA